MGGDLPDEYRTNPVASSVIQHQHEHLAEEVRRLKEENKRLESRQYLIQSSRKSMLDKLCESLGWQGGTIHQVLAEVRRLKGLETCDCGRKRGGAVCPVCDNDE